MKAVLNMIQKPQSSNDVERKDCKQNDINQSNLISQANTSPQTIWSLNTSNQLKKSNSIQDRTTNIKEKPLIK